MASQSILTTASMGYGGLDNQLSISDISQNASVSAVGYVNDYVVNLAKRYMSEDVSTLRQGRKMALSEIMQPTDYSDLKNSLSQKIDQHKQAIGDGKNGDAQRMVINSLMLEKIKDREELASTQRSKMILSICVVIVPLLTNLLQFIVSYFEEYKKSC